MTKTDIKRQLESATGKSFLCISEIARCLGMGKTTRGHSWRDWIICHPGARKGT